MKLQKKSVKENLMTKDYKIFVIFYDEKLGVFWETTFWKEKVKLELLLGFRNWIEE